MKPFWFSVFLALLLTGLPDFLLAQRQPYFAFFQQEYFFGNLPSPRAEAMARADVAVGGSLSSIFYNPAGIGTIQDWGADFSTSGPFYLLQESDYYFAGYARRVHEKLVVAVSGHQLRVGPTSFDVIIGPTNYFVQNPVASNLAFTAAAEPIENLHVGLNVNLFAWKLFDGQSPGRTIHLDLGALYVVPLREGSELRLGASANNFLFSDLSFSSPDGSQQSSNVFPAIARAGLTYVKELTIEVPGAGTQPLQLLLTTEMQDLLNADFRTAFRLGGEVVLAKVLALRLGVYTISEDDMGFVGNRDRVNDFTYGFGIIVPLTELSNGKLPFDAHLDYYSLEPAPVVFGSSQIPNKRGFGIRLVAPISPQR